MSVRPSSPSGSDNLAMTRTVAEHPDTVSVLHDQAARRRLSDGMKDMGIRGGPTNIAIFAEGLRRGIPITATRSRGMKLHGDSKQWWNNGGSSLNHAAARRICPQKEVNSRVFRARGIRAPENTVFAPGEAKRAWAWAQALLPAVIKPFDGARGEGVNTGLTRRSQFLATFDEVSKVHGHVLVEQQLTGTEHRVFIVGQNVKAVLRQVPANIVGDGRSTVTELIAKKNRSAVHPHKPISLGEVELSALKALRLTPKSIVDKGSQIILRANTNLSTGGDSIDATDELSADELEFVKNAASCWPGLGCAGIDVMLPRKHGDGPPAVIEINSAAGISAHLVPRFGEPRNVARSIVDAMFPGTAESS